VFSGGGLQLLIVFFFFGLSAGVIAKIKGNGPGGIFTWFLIGFCIPFVGVLCAMFYRYENQELRRECPRCHRVVMLYDAVCMHCGDELAFPDVAIAPAARTQELRRQQQRRQANAG
jgi:hypothetical protein